MRSAGDNQVVANYARKTQRGEWDPIQQPVGVFSDVCVCVCVCECLRVCACVCVSFLRFISFVLFVKKNVFFASILFLSPLAATLLFFFYLFDLLVKSFF